MDSISFQASAVFTFQRLEIFEGSPKEIHFEDYTEEEKSGVNEAWESSVKTDEHDRLRCQRDGLHLCHIVRQIVFYRIDVSLDRLAIEIFRCDVKNFPTITHTCNKYITSVSFDSIRFKLTNVYSMFMGTKFYKELKKKILSPEITTLKRILLNPSKITIPKIVFQTLINISLNVPAIKIPEILKIIQTHCSNLLFLILEIWLDRKFQRKISKNLNLFLQ